MNYNLKDICDSEVKKIDSPIIEAGGVSAIVGAVGIVNPVIGVGADAAAAVAEKYSEFKFELLIKGLSKGLNRETYLNELFNYVNEGKEQALTVANIFRKTINAECLKVCIIYGLILSKHINDKSAFSHEELIVCKHWKVHQIMKYGSSKK